MRDKTAGIFDKIYRFTLGICLFLSLILISCGTEQGDWTAVQREGRYIYGVWHSTTAKKAEQMLLKVAENPIPSIFLNKKALSFPLKEIKLKICS